MSPFTTSPFEVETTVSPLNTVPKKDSVERRIIVDLSYPKHSPDRSINGEITQNIYLGDPIQLCFREKGPGCSLFKCDFIRAYRHLPVDPGDLHYLGYKWEGGLFVDLTLIMGLRSAAYLWQRITNTIAYIAKKNGINVSKWRGLSQAFLKLQKSSGSMGPLRPFKKHNSPSCGWFFRHIYRHRQDGAGGCARQAVGVAQTIAVLAVENFSIKKKKRHKASLAFCNLWPFASSLVECSWPDCSISVKSARAGGINNFRGS